MSSVDTSLSRRGRRAVTSMVADEIVRNVATVLAPTGAIPMPFKGALLQHWLYADPSERAMTDVDMLVRPEELLGCRRALEGAGYARLGQSSIGAQVLKSPYGLAVDLHPRLFDPARYSLSTSAVFARGCIDETTFGVPVRLPAPLDAYAHLVGKFASDHCGHRDGHRLDEIRRMGRYLLSPPSEAADHLVHTGMRRAARYVLPLSAESGDEFATTLLKALPSDPVGSLVAGCSRRILSSIPQTSPVGSVVAHMLNRSFSAGIRSGLRALRA